MPRPRARYASRLAAMRDPVRAECRRRRARRRRISAMWRDWIEARDAGRDPGPLPPFPDLDDLMR